MHCGRYAGLVECDEQGVGEEDLSTTAAWVFNKAKVWKKHAPGASTGGIDTSSSASILLR